MNDSRNKVMAAAMFALIAPFAPVLAKTPQNAPAVQSVKGEMIVKLKKGMEKSFLQNKSRLQTLGMQVEREVSLSYGKLFVVSFEGQSQKSAIQSLSSSPEVEYAEPNFIYSVGKVDREDVLNLAPNDPSFEKLWGLQNTGTNEPSGIDGKEIQGVAGADIDALRAWDITTGSRRVKIAIIDTGIDYTHPDLKDNMWVNLAEKNGKAGVDDDGNGYIDDVYGYDFANNDGDARDDHSHGTHCAGTIGALHNNGIGVAGVMSEVTLIPVKCLTSSGSGTLENAIKSIDYATKMNVDIMSNSWGGGGYSRALEDAIKNAGEKGIIFTAAAGNNATNNDATAQYPASYVLPNVVSVAAHTSTDSLATFSCYGSRTVHVAAPGHRILSTVIDGKYAVYSGTSMATPHVSGVLGLLLAKEGRMPHAEMRERLMATSVPVASYRRKSISNGRVNAYNLLTNTRPARNEPGAGDWKKVTLSEKFETDHPYAANAKITRTLSFPGAKFVRLRVARYDFESGYDFLKVFNGARGEVESLTGTGNDYVTDYVEGNTITIEMSSDYSENRWGALVEEAEVIPE